MSNKKHLLSKRFRGFYPVVMDIETAGFDAKKDAILEIAAITLSMNKSGLLSRDKTFHFHIEPFAGANLNPESLAFTGIKPDNPFRMAISEREALTSLFDAIQERCQAHDCQRAVMVAHNAMFDLGFIQAAMKRCKIEKSPLHHFTTFDTATLSGLAYGQTVLARAVEAAGITYDAQLAHSALYDAQITSELFCNIVNRWKELNSLED